MRHRTKRRGHGRSTNASPHRCAACGRQARGLIGWAIVRLHAVESRELILHKGLHDPLNVSIARHVCGKNHIQMSVRNILETRPEVLAHCGARRCHAPCRMESSGDDERPMKPGGSSTCPAEEEHLQANRASGSVCVPRRVAQSQIGFASLLACNGRQL